MVKDEAANVAALIESTRGIVDRVVVVDTGSTDGTPASARSAADAIGVPLLLVEEPSLAVAVTRSFAESRNRALAIHDEGDAPVFSLMLSGDEVLRDGADLRAFLEKRRDSSDGAFAITMSAGDGTWRYPRVFRSGGGWKYIGAVHELPVAPDGGTVAPPAPGVVVHTVTDPERRSRRIRDFDLPVLTDIVADTRYTLPERARAMYFLAESHAALAADYSSEEIGGPWLTHQMTAMSLYWRCGRLLEDSNGGVHDHAKAIYAYFFYFHIAEKVGFFTYDELLPRVEALTQADPLQPEARFLAAKCAAYVDPRRGLFLAEEATRVALAARTTPRHLPTDGRISWTAMHIAATCARALKNTKRMRELAERGVHLGGPAEAFKEFLT